MKIGCGTQWKPSTDDPVMTQQLIGNDSVTARLARLGDFCSYFIEPGQRRSRKADQNSLQAYPSAPIGAQMPP